MNLLTFDIETIPDADGGRRIHGIQDTSDTDMAEILFHYRRQQTNGKSEFLRHYLQRIVAISVLIRHRDQFHLRTLGDTDSTEQELITQFFALIAATHPTLISWNGRRFDQPVLHYRALLHGIACPSYWDRGELNRDFKWNNYLSRYHLRHIDLMDTISNYDMYATAPLHELCLLLGLPGKSNMHGSEVWEHYQQGRINEIRSYCETDVLNTYLLYLRYSLIQGSLGKAEYDTELTIVHKRLQDATAPHLQDYLKEWAPS